MSYKVSVCIPAYNRPQFLTPLLDSIMMQDHENFEVVICEDNSPKRPQIKEIVSKYIKKYPKKIFYYENQTNLGYDGNLRNLVAKASGDYCMFMGNDDLMAADAISEVSSLLDRHKNIGVILRTYASFDDSPDKINQAFRYFKEEKFFLAGSKAISTFFRRSVVISGLVIHRLEALKYSTDRFDGTLLYQLYLVSRILTTMNGVFTPKVLALYRNGGIPDFGNSKKEKDRFTPRNQTPESSLHFMRGMLDIAKWVDETQNIRVYKAILTDIGNYCYPILSIQSKRTTIVFIKYCYYLGAMGFWKNKMFFLYFVLLIMLGSHNVDLIIQFIKKRLGHTPVIGKVFRGDSS